MNCTLCGSVKLSTLYEAKDIPVFQNRVYESTSSAKSAPLGSVKLVHCGNCDYIFNAKFDECAMVYDDGYQNEQAHSPYFQSIWPIARKRHANTQA